MPNTLTNNSPWEYVTDNVLLSIFSNLCQKDLMDAACVCKNWYRVAHDEYIWRDLFLQDWKIQSNVSLAPGRSSWYAEYKRLQLHVPRIESEVLTEHKDQVLHVSFSHDGKMFATSSKDGYIKVWNSQYPASVKYCADMKEFSWKYTQFSQFNKSDKLILVSGVHFGSQSTSGEIVVFGLADKLELKCRVLNKPYDIFGTWYNETYLLSGNLHVLGSNLSSCTSLWLNRAYQMIEPAKESTVMKMYRFYNTNASTIRTILVANCTIDVNTELCCANSVWANAPSALEKHRKRQHKARCQSSRKQRCEDKAYLSQKHYVHQHSYEMNDPGSDDDADVGDQAAAIDEEHPANQQMSADDEGGGSDSEGEVTESSSNSSSCEEGGTAYYNTTASSTSHPQVRTQKLLIFTTGTKTYTPHKVGIKHIQPLAADMDEEDDLLPPRSTEQSEDDVLPHQVLPIAPPAVQPQHMEYDSIDHLLELHGHVIGMCLSPDHRYLYVNCRPWPHNYEIPDSLEPPPIAQEIDIHIIDLHTITEIRTMHQSHKAYTPNDDCFFIFLDVCEDYVASGAEDKHGYIWDRHYGTCLYKYAHTDVVNCVAFNPVDSEMLITTSDDHTLKIWRSVRRDRQVKSATL